MARRSTHHLEHNLPSDLGSSASEDEQEDDFLDHAHAVFHQMFVTASSGQMFMNVRFRQLDERRMVVRSLGDFAEALGNLNGALDDQELLAVYEFYEVATKGLEEFLLGLRYILQVQESELAYTCKKIRTLIAHVQPKASTPSGLTAALQSLGMVEVEMSYEDFQQVMEESFSDDVTPSEAALIFSAATNRRREGCVPASRLVALIVGEAFQNPKTQPLSRSALSTLDAVRAIGTTVYASHNMVGSRLGLLSHMQSYDKDDDGFLQPAEFRAAVAAVHPLGRGDEDQLLHRMLDEASGKVPIDDFVQLFSIFDFADIQPQSVVELVSLICGEVGRRMERDGAPALHRLAHRHDAGGTGRLSLEEFAAFIREACDMAVADVDCEVLFGHLAHREEFLMWKPLLDSCAPRKAGSSLKEEEEELDRRSPVPLEVEQLLTSMARQLLQTQTASTSPTDALGPMQAAFRRRDGARADRVSQEQFRDVLRDAWEVLPRDADRLFRWCAGDGAKDLDYLSFMQSLAEALANQHREPQPPHLATAARPASDVWHGGRTQPEPETTGLEGDGSPTPHARPSMHQPPVFRTEALMAMLLREVQRTFSNPAAAQGALAQEDRDGDGKLGRAEFTAAMQTGGVRLTSRQLDVLFDRHSQAGLLSIGLFVGALQQLPTDAPAQHSTIAKELAMLQVAFRNVGSAVSLLKAFFARYDTRHRGGLTLLEWTKAVGDCSPDVPVKVCERVHHYFTENSGEFTFEDFLVCAQGPRQNAIRSTGQLQEVLLGELYGVGRGNRVQGSLALAKLLRFYDHHQGQLDREHFGRAMAALGLGFSKAEVDELFMTHDLDGTGFIAISEFVDSLRLRQLYAPPPPELQRLMQTVQDSFVARGLLLQKPQPIRDHFRRLDPDATGHLDLVTFARALHEVCDVHLTDFEAELLFNHFSSYGLCSTDYEKFVTVLTSQQTHHATAVKEAMVPVPVTEREVASFQEALLRLFYARGTRTAGTVHLTVTLRAMDKDGDGHLTLPQFLDALGRFDLASVGLSAQDLCQVYTVWGTAEQPLLPIDPFVAAYRARADLNLPSSEYNAIIEELQQCLRDKLGHQRSRDRIRLWFEKQLPDPQFGSMDLFVFTRSIRNFCQKALSDLTIEQLFHTLCPDCFGRLSMDLFVNCLLNEPPPSAIPPLSPAQTSKLMQTLGELWFDACDLQQRHSQVRFVLTRFNVEDRDGDGHVTLKEFQHAIRTWPVANTDAQLEALFNVFQVGGLVNIGEFIRAVRSHQRPAIQSAADLEHVLAHLRQVVERQGHAGARTVFRVFERFDIDGDGRLDLDAFERALRQTLGQMERPLTQHDVQLLFQVFDTDGQGSINFHKFLQQVGWGAHRLQSPPQPRPSPPQPTSKPGSR
eukprot:GGOE01015280.1.p1 GENE.GGOE01015280.1~~GGOE01015280.1.p1  ORF type:complete len:1405 (+),score=365.64 GGOE01015280.1:52-4215(+)